MPEFETYSNESNKITDPRFPSDGKKGEGVEGYSDAEYREEDRKSAEAAQRAAIDALKAKRDSRRK